MSDLRLKSDFTDFYDHRFVGSWNTAAPVWSRYSTTARTREDDHDLMQAAGLVVPSRGRLDDMFGGRQVVAYTSYRAHRGEGKERGTVRELLDRGLQPELYAAAWVGDPAGGRSLRLLSTGRAHWWLIYQARTPGEWRSNVGDVEITYAGRDDVPRDFDHDAIVASGKLQRWLREPLLAIDFVHDGTHWVAVDLNTAPGIRGTPVEQERVAAADVAESITRRWWELQAMPAGARP